MFEHHLFLFLPCGAAMRKLRARQLHESNQGAPPPADADEWDMLGAGQWVCNSCINK